MSEQVPLVRRFERAVGAPEDALVVAAVVVDGVAVHANLCNSGRGTLKKGVEMGDCHIFHNDDGGGGGGGGWDADGEEEEAEKEGGEEEVRKQTRIFL